MIKLSLETALQNILPIIQEHLGCEIYGIERVTKIYGSNANSFLLKTTSNNHAMRTYFLKFGRDGSIKEEIEGTTKLKSFLPTPEIIMFSKDSCDWPWILYEYIQGKLLSEIAVSTDIEIEKEKLLTQMYSKTAVMLDAADYLACPANNLFYGRLTGKKYEEFYSNADSSISKFFGLQISLNGKFFQQSINEVFFTIKRKFTEMNSPVRAYLGHGDAHYGNIILGKSKLYFIDNEYAGYIPALMEMSKPYYNDFIGTLFFHFPQILEDYFSLEGVDLVNSNLSIRVNLKKKMDPRIRMIQKRIEYRKDFLQGDNVDFLSLNNYLFLCHTLTRNPNDYPESTKYLFLAFALVIANFDPFHPESIYSYF